MWIPETKNNTIENASDQNLPGTNPENRITKSEVTSQARAQIKITDFLKKHCIITGINLESKKRYIQRLNADKKNKLKLPEAINANNRIKGGAYMYYLDELLDCWPSLCKNNCSLPVLKSRHK